MLTVEFTIEPFVEGAPGAHVTAAVAAVEQRGLVVDFGPFGSSFAVPQADLPEAVASLMQAAYANGATVVSIDVGVVSGARPPALHGALDRIIESVERELGNKLSELSRNDKQKAIRLLDDQGAFILRRAVEDVADAMKVSRITVYNYLNAIHR